MWIGVKRFLLLIAGAVTAVLGAGCIASALLGYYGDHAGLIAGIAVCGALLVAFGAFVGRIAIRGSDRDVEETDLL